MQEDDAVDVVDFPPPKSVIQLIREALGEQPRGFGMLAAIASLAVSQSADSSGLVPLLWLAMARQPGLQAHAVLPAGAATAHISGGQDLGSIITGMDSRRPQLGGVQMLHMPAHIH